MWRAAPVWRIFSRPISQSHRPPVAAYTSRTGIKALAAHCPELRQLRLSGCNVSDNGLRPVLSCCTKLRELEISRNGRITPASLERAPASCASPPIPLATAPPLRRTTSPRARQPTTVSAHRPASPTPRVRALIVRLYRRDLRRYCRHCRYCPFRLHRRDLRRGATAIERSGARGRRRGGRDAATGALTEGSTGAIRGPVSSKILPFETPNGAIRDP